jgi:hypothetical protein
MQKSQHSGSILGDNRWAKAFEQFDEDAFFARLHHQVKNKPYYERYRSFKQTVTILSYIFSVAGALTSAYAVYWLASWAGAALWLSLAIGGLILVFLERIKRKASEEAWQVYFFEGKIAAGWILLSLALLVIGILSSSFGAKEGAKDFAPLAQLITTDTTADHYHQRVAHLEAENLRLSRQRNAQGEIYWPAQQQMARNRQTIAQYEERILALDSKREQTNDGLQASHAANVAFASRVFMLVQIGMELCFEACIAWIWYFLYRSYVERQVTSPTSPSPSHRQHSRSPLASEDDPEIAEEENPLPESAIVLETTQANGGFTAFPYTSPPSGNGRHIPPAGSHHRPIGFYTDRQRAMQEERTRDQESAPVQTCTELYTETITLHEDRYTVLHRYQRGGRIYQTPYTRNQILARISQYERDLQEATRKNMNEEILQNRRQWLAYWQGKLRELEEKINK